ncbi:MAG: hypothetical protein Q9182_004333 [Xanthomendoza sp. 2 TL-2023]
MGINIWNIFYHMLISEADLFILQEHTTKLLKASESLEKWLTSSYGDFIQLINAATLKELRQYWTQYKTIDVSGKINTDVRDGMSQRTKDLGTLEFFQGVRSAGPLWMSGMEVCSYVYRKYWETGVAGGNSTDYKELNGKGRGLANPMFVVSSAPSGKFAVHYGSEPLLGFHLAETFRELHTGEKLALAAQSDRLVEMGKAQFNEWCGNFALFVEHRRFCVQLFSGDAVALCYQLQLGIACGRQGDQASFYSKPWKLQPLHLDGHVGHDQSNWPPLGGFDVIDTSNLSDHIGLINMVAATAPLMRRRQTSILCTESLLAASDSADSALPAALGTDVATFSLLVGLAPIGLLAGVTLEAVSSEAALQSFFGSSHVQRQKQYRLRVHWKSPDVQPRTVPLDSETDEKTRRRVKVDSRDLATWFLSMYKKMFAHEDVSTLFSRMQRMQSKSYSTDMQRYTRAAIVALIRVVKTNVLADWGIVMNTFLSMVATDQSLLVGSNSLQDFYMQLALFGVWTMPVLAEGPRQVQQRLNLPLRPRNNVEKLLGEIDPPPIVHIIFSVPRKQLEVLTGRGNKMIGTPGMHVSVKQEFGAQQYDNHFYRFHCYFGKFLREGKDDRPPLFEEDDKGWQGSADLVVVCAAPTFGLLTGPRNGLKVSLALNNSPDNIMLFSSKLGPMLTVSEISLENEQRVLISRNPPFMDTSYSMAAQRNWLQTYSTGADSDTAASAIFDADHRANKLLIRTVFAKGSEEAEALANGAAVNVVSKDLSTIHLKLGTSLSRTVVFPFPVQSSNSKTRIARKSGWVEVEAAIHTAAKEDVFDTWTRLDCTPSGSLSLSSLPRVSLDVQPKIMSISKRDEWMKILTGGTFSEGEKHMMEQGGDLSVHPKIQLKESLNILFQSFAGFHPQTSGPVRTFQLTKRKDCHTIIFVNSMRHDLDLGSVVLDAWVLPLTIKRVHELSVALSRLISAKPEPLGVQLSDRESILWKRMLPALAERCRTSNHEASCEYRADGKIPLSVEDDQNPLCSCGEGKVPTDFAKVVKEWAPFAKYVTRIAIAPVFPVPYLESILQMPQPGTSTAAPASRCDKCGTTSGQMMSCAGCRGVRYCSKACQKAGWKTHKPYCKK